MSLVTINSSKKKLTCSITFDKVGGTTILIDTINIKQIVSSQNIKRVWKSPGTRLKFKLYPDDSPICNIYRVVSGYGYINRISNSVAVIYENKDIVTLEIRVQTYTTRFMKRKKKNAQASVSSKDC